MGPTRREMVLGCAAAVPALAGLAAGVPAAAAARQRRLGVVIHSFGIRRSAERRLDDPLTFLRHCHGLGAGGVQTSLGVRDEGYAARLRRAQQEGGMYLEGSLALPRDGKDVDRFEAEVRSAAACGATVLRTVALTGRRYETFRTAEAFRRFAAAAWESLRLAEPVVRRHKVR